jgi:two-component system sensor histidine kinase KdpD
VRISDQIRREMRGIGLALLVVAAMTAVMVGLVDEAGLAHGSVLYSIPVLIAASRWGLNAALVAGGTASAFFFYPPLHGFIIKDPQEVVDLALFVFVAVVTSQLAARLKRPLEIARKREIDMRDLYAFSRRLAVAFGVSDIHAAIEDHLSTIMQRKVTLFAAAQCDRWRSFMRPKGR